MERYLNQLDKIIELYNKVKEQEAFEKIKQLRETIIFDIALKNSNSKYDREQLKAAKALLKNASDDRPLFKKMYKIDDTFQLCDGYVAVVLNNSIQGLELNTADCDYLDCRKIMKTASGKYLEYDSNYKKVEYDLLKLEQQAILTPKNKDKDIPIEYLSHFKETYYNSLYVLRAIKILGTKGVEIYANEVGIRSPIYLKSELGQALVLPILMPIKTNDK